MENKDALLHILSVNRTKFQIPGRKFRERLADELEVRNPDKYIEKYKKEFQKKQEDLRKIDLKISPLSIGLYNAVVDTGSKIDIKKILEKVKKNGLVSENGIKVTQFTIRYGKFKTALSYTSEYGLVGDESLPFVSADFQIKVTKGGKTKGASLSYYTSGKVRFSGGHLDSLEKQPKELVQFFSKHYHPIPRSEIQINNITSEFKLGFPLKTSLIYDMFSDIAVKSSFGAYDVVAKYTDKKFLYITFSDKFSIVVADTGVVQIQGTTDVDEAYDVSKKFFDALKDNDFLVTSGNRVQNIRVQSPKETKISRRHDNKPAPNITRRGTTCPLARRPNPYSYEGKCSIPGCYIKPNPQGQPCCYTVPKSIKYSRNRVENAYNKAGVKVPAQIRTLFGFGLKTNARPVNIANKNVQLNVRTYTNKKSGFKLNSRQCMRYTKVALVDMATRLKIVLPKKLTKPILCDLIKKAAPASNNVSAGGKLISGANHTLRLGKRLCATYPRDVLVRFARTLGGKVYKEMTKDEICSLIQKLSRKNVVVAPPVTAKKKLSNDELYNYIEQFSMNKHRAASPNKPRTPVAPAKKRLANDELYNYIEQFSMNKR